MAIHLNLESDEQGIPIAIVDGYIPTVKRIHENLQLAHTVKYSGLANRPDDSRYAFIGISQMINDYLQDARGGSIDHWVIFPPSEVAKTAPGNIPRTPLEELLTSRDVERERDHTPPYCINVLVGAATRNCQRLHSHVVGWLAATGFQLKEPETYIDFMKFRSDCRNVRQYLQRINPQSIDSTVRTVEENGRCRVYRVS